MIQSEVRVDVAKINAHRSQVQIKVQMRFRTGVGELHSQWT